MGGQNDLGDFGIVEHVAVVEMTSRVQFLHGTAKRIISYCTYRLRYPELGTPYQLRYLK